MLIDLRGTDPVDRVFLKHLEDYRLRFARTLFEENRSNFPEANTRHGAARLTEATQRLIDRLVIMRVCEDRDITSYGNLRDIVNKASENRLDLYSEVTTEFRRLDAQYNGYLFKAHFSEQLKVSSELLADFIRSLYPPDGAYRFDAIGDDLLGIIYERFLGSVITVDRNQVKAAEKPEVRHAGGIYYTPRFVVDTIIRRVVGPKVEGKSPLEVLGIKILDPACDKHLFEVKWDGTRCLGFIEDDRLRLQNRHLIDIGDRYPELACLRGLPALTIVKTETWGFYPKAALELLYFDFGNSLPHHRLLAFHSCPGKGSYTESKLSLLEIHLLEGYFTYKLQRHPATGVVGS